MIMKKIIVVEGKADKQRLLHIISEPVEVICTHGTISPYHLEELLSPYEDEEIFIFMDMDFEGERIRHAIVALFPHAKHLYTDVIYIEVERTPFKLLATILSIAHIQVYTEFLQ